MDSRPSSGRFEVMQNGKPVSILNPVRLGERDGWENDNFNRLCVLARAAVDAAIAREDAAVMAEVHAEAKMHRDASDEFWLRRCSQEVLDKKFPLDDTPSDTPSPPPRSAPVGRPKRPHKPPRRGRWSSDFPSSRFGPWLRRCSTEYLDKHFPLDDTPLATPSRSKGSSSVITLPELDPVPAPVPAPAPAPVAVAVAAPIVRRARPRSVACGVSGCTRTFSSKNIADHRKSHILDAAGGSEQARQPCKACACTGKPCMVSTSPTDAQVNTYSCLACLKSHRGCSHKEHGRANPRPRRHPALDSPSH